MTDNKIKKAPDTAGYYWLKTNGVWHLVEVYIATDRSINYKMFSGYCYPAASHTEWIGPIFPETTALFKTTAL